MRRNRITLWLLVALVLVMLGVGGLYGLTLRSALPLMAAAAPPPDSQTLLHGAQLAAIGNCNTCHTADNGAAYAGGRPIETPFGTIYATNITPDRDTGIGGWSEEAFIRAMREGVSRDGHHLYPAFPYDHMARMRDDDIKAVYAFIMTRRPVRATTPPNALTFPLNFRPLVAGWKLLFLDRGVIQPNASQSPEWNRGAYLVEGLGHCGACHTPRNALGAEKRGQAYAGGESEGWIAPALNAASPAAVPWNEERLYAYLRTGYDPLHGAVAGPMAPVVANFAAVPQEDVRAIATYVAFVAGNAGPERQARAREAVARAKGEASAPEKAASLPGAPIYAGACAQCHGEAGRAPLMPAVNLALSSSLRNPRPDNVIRIVRGGIHPVGGGAGPVMPGFAGALTDAQLVALLGYLRAAFTESPPWGELENAVARAIRNEDQERTAQRARLLP